MPAASSPNAFRRYIWPLFLRRCWLLLAVLAKGRLAQDGTYAELVGQPGLFQDLVHGQSLRE